MGEAGTGPLVPLLFWSVVLCLSSQSQATEGRNKCDPSPLVTCPRRTSPHIEDAARPPINDSTVCDTDLMEVLAGRAKRTTVHMKVNVLVRGTDCQPVAGAELFVSQAGLSGTEQADCGGKLTTDEHGMISFQTVRPKHYRDIKYPDKLRPRLIQLEVRPQAGCAYHGMEEDDSYFTQFYFRNDGRRPLDPCPSNHCHSDKSSQFFRCHRNSTQRICNVTITLPAEVCEPPTKPAARSFISSESIDAAPTTAEKASTTATANAPATEAVCMRPRATQWDTPGPFYEDNQPLRNPMCTEDPNYATSPKLTLNFKLSDRSCRPLRHFFVDVWSADSNGNYRDHCRSLLQTNASGMFTLETIKPAPYPGRPKHLHYLVHATRLNNMCHGQFTTQSYFPERYDYASLVKSCRDDVTGDNTIRGLICDFNIVLHDPRPCS